MGFDSKYARDTYNLLRRFGGERILFDSLVVLGEENLEDKGQTLEIANHISHADYAARWWASYTRDKKIPMIPAGINLNSPVLKFLHLDFSKLCGFWVDRNLLGSNGKGSFTHARALYKIISEVSNSGENLLIFGDGGRYEGKPMGRFEPAGARAFIRNNHDLWLRNIAFGYDTRVEEWVKERVAVHRKKKDFLYKFYDFSAFALRPFIRQFTDVGSAYMNVGVPVRISDIAGSGGVDAKVDAIRKYSASDLSRLCDEIEQAKKR